MGFDDSIRKNQVGLFEWAEERDWIFSQLEGVAFSANNAFFGLHLAGYTERLQISCYNPDDHYTWHTDYGVGALSIRKLSQVVVLSDSSDYIGGTFEFNMTSPKELILNQGDCL